MTPATSPATAPEESTPDGRATRWDDHLAARRSRILDAAIELVREAGGEVAVRDIADRAKAPRSVIYRIFRDRADLDEQVRTEIVARLMAVLAPTLEPEGTVRESIDRAVSTYVDWVSRNPQLHQFLGTGSTRQRTTGSRVVTGTRTQVARDLTALLEAVATKAGVDPLVAEPLAFGLVGLVDGAVNRWVTSTHTRVPAEHLAQFLADSIWALLRAQSGELGITLTARTRVKTLL